MKRKRPPRADLSTWRRNADCSRSRVYGSYEEYVAHQQSKLATMTPETLREHSERFREALLARLVLHSASRLGHRWGAVLCLGARTGAEVEAFVASGCRSAVGIDLNPASPLVLAGDFHDIAFPTGSFDTVYTNSLDHVFDLTAVMTEAHRVLRPGGCLIVEATRKQPGDYEAFAWVSTEDLQTAIEGYGFRLVSRDHITEPWSGDQLVMERT